MNNAFFDRPFVNTALGLLGMCKKLAASTRYLTREVREQSPNIITVIKAVIITQLCSVQH